MVVASPPSSSSPSSVTDTRNTPPHWKLTASPRGCIRYKGTTASSSSSSSKNHHGHTTQTSSSSRKPECRLTCGIVLTRRALLLVVGGCLCLGKLAADVYLVRVSLLRDKNDNQSYNDHDNIHYDSNTIHSSNSKHATTLTAATADRGLRGPHRHHKETTQPTAGTFVGRGLYSQSRSRTAAANTGLLVDQMVAAAAAPSFQYNIANNNNNTANDNNHHSSPSSSSPYAYAFVIGGVNPDRPAYKGFLYNILVSTRVLRQLGSTADVVAFFQLAYAYHTNNHNDNSSCCGLPDADVAALRGLGIHIYYIAPSPHESFYETVLHKFQILQLTQYRRVILMDGDVMPVSNLDYLFHLSDDHYYGMGNSTLRENVLVAGPWEPANAGFFMLAPAPGDYEAIQDIIRQRHQQAEADGVVLFDEVKGWGHVIEEGDEWVSRRERGRNWTFHFAFSDQGLLYHWTKYVKKSVSIVYQDQVENWSPIVVDDDGTTTKAVKERVLDRPFLNYSNPLVSQYGSCTKFMCDFIHFSGVQKPWLRKPLIDNLNDRNKLDKGEHIWWYFLMVVDHELGLHLDFHNWPTDLRPPLGLYAKWGDMGKHNQKTAALTQAAATTAE